MEVRFAAFLKTVPGGSLDISESILAYESSASATGILSGAKTAAQYITAVSNKIPTVRNFAVRQPNVRFSDTWGNYFRVRKALSSIEFS